MPALPACGRSVTSRARMQVMLTGTIAELHRDRGTGSIRGDDGRMYTFRRTALKDGWFHELTEGVHVTFSVPKPPPHFEASDVSVVRDAS
jgi:cold shock CspA family protein